MKKHIFSIVFSFGVVFCTKAQQIFDLKRLRVVDIINYKDAYVIKCIDQNLDTLKILSQKEIIKKRHKCRYDEIKVGATYNIELRKRSVYIHNLVIKCNNTVYWKSGDKIEDMPYFSTNIKDLYIKNEPRKATL